MLDKKRRSAHPDLVHVEGKVRQVAGLGIFHYLLACVSTKDYCYFVKGGKEARRESALGRHHSD